MGQLKMLLVDDHPGFTAAAMRHLRRLAWRDVVGTASNGIEAIAQCEMLHPNGVLMVWRCDVMPLLEQLAANPEKSE